MIKSVSLIKSKWCTIFFLNVTARLAQLVNAPTQAHVHSLPIEVQLPGGQSPARRDLKMVCVAL